MATTFFHQFISPLDPAFSVIIEDDGKVAYAYLLNHDQIIADVWLYNQSQTPETTNWHDREGMPFLNPLNYTDYQMPDPLTELSEVSAVFSMTADKKHEVRIFIREQYTALLISVSKPGWCIHAKVSGPLAKVIQP